MEDRGIDRNGSRKYVAPWQGKAVTTGPLEDFELTGFPCQECPKRNDFSEAGKSHTILLSPAWVRAINTRKASTL